jgi:hypothetical protein
MLRKLANGIGRGPGRLWRSVLGQFGAIAAAPVEPRLVPAEIRRNDAVRTEPRRQPDERLDWGDHDR